MPSFADLKLNKQLLDALQDLGYKEPTPIQKKAIPLVLAGHDVLGLAQTGTGKTAAYLLPILKKLQYAQEDHPRALVLVPTRELARQVEQAAADFSKYLDLRCLAIYGGLGPKTQIESVKQGIDLLIATPGRFLDLYHRGVLFPRLLHTLIMDEADKMMDMGFLPQIHQILEVIPTKRQNLLFSATMPDSVLKLSEDFLAFPERVEITPQASPAETVTHYFYRVPNLKTKTNLLLHLLEDTEKFKRVIVFVRTRKNADNIYKFLSRKLPTESLRVIHANKGQNTRTNAIEAFKSGEIRVLVATDVLARGIDVTMVSHVINFDIPLVYEDYVHRIGRTGRAQELGEAISFVTDADIYHLKKIEKLIRGQIPLRDLPPEVEVTETPKEEAQAIAREIDRQKRKENPEYQGAFHAKKTKSKASSSTKRRKKPKK